MPVQFHSRFLFIELVHLVSTDEIKLSSKYRKIERIILKSHSSTIIKI